MYSIKITYETGDSYSTRTETDFVDMEWGNLEIAEENLDRIKEHYEYYEANNDHSFYGDKKGRDLIIGRAKTRPWFFKRYDFCLMLLDDKNKEFQYHTFWCGYFERLLEAEIVQELKKFKV